MVSEGFVPNHSFRIS
jgi:hypothetical protein